MYADPCFLLVFVLDRVEFAYLDFFIDAYYKKAPSNFKTFVFILRQSAGRRFPFVPRSVESVRARRERTQTFEKTTYYIHYHYMEYGIRAFFLHKKSSSFFRQKATQPKHKSVRTRVATDLFVLQQLYILIH